MIALVPGIDEDLEPNDYASGLIMLFNNAVGLTLDWAGKKQRRGDGRWMITGPLRNWPDHLIRQVSH